MYGTPNQNLKGSRVLQFAKQNMQGNLDPIPKRLRWNKRILNQTAKFAKLQVEIIKIGSAMHKILYS